jgi:hypothetical protein
MDRNFYRETVLKLTLKKNSYTKMYCFIAIVKLRMFVEKKIKT